MSDNSTSNPYSNGGPYQTHNQPSDYRATVKDVYFTNPPVDGNNPFSGGAPNEEPVPGASNYGGIIEMSHDSSPTTDDYNDDTGTNLSLPRG